MMQNSSIRPAVPNVDFHGGRILVPRQDRPKAQPASTRKPRAQKACTTCRKRKSKCSGDTPQCIECAANELPCVYDHNRRDRLKELTSQKQLLVDLVQELRLPANAPDRQKIEDVLDELEEEYPPLSDATSQEIIAPRANTDEDFNVASGHPAHSVADNVDIVDFWAATHDSHFVQGPEERGTQWLPDLHEDLTLSGGDGFPSDIAGNTTLKYTPDASFYLPNSVLEIDPFVAVYERPPAEVAYRLIPHYLHTCHDWISMLPSGFEAQVQRFYDMPDEVPNKWLAIFNLVLAIGARHSFLINRNAHANSSWEREDIPYISRAMRLLGLKESALMTTDPDISQIQCHGLLSLYYLTVHHIEKAWLTVGVALRFGVALNLHLKCQDDYPYPGRSEMLARTWWGLRSLECFLSSTIGRPSAFPLQDCNAPLPHDPPAIRHGTRSTSMLRLYIKITINTQWALSSLYTVRAATLPWQNIHDRVVKLKSELETLLPQITDRERLILQFSWFDSMILITRPFLSPQRDRNDVSEHRRHISHTIARDCIQAAQGVTRLLSDDPDECIHHNGPWWCLAHYIMRALAVFLLAMSSQVSIEVHSDLVSPVKKLIRWLRWMRQEDPVAGQGLKAVLNTLRKGVHQVEFASVFEQESMDAYDGGYLHTSGNWPAAAEPQYLSEFHGLDDLLDSDGVIHNMVAHSQPDMLPMPPMYGNPYASTDNTWDW